MTLALLKCTRDVNRAMENYRKRKTEWEGHRLLYQVNCAPLLSPSDSKFRFYDGKIDKIGRNVGSKVLRVCLWSLCVCVCVCVCDACIFQAENNLMYFSIWLYLFKSRFSLIITKWEVFWLNRLFLSIICHKSQHPDFSGLLLMWPWNLSSKKQPSAAFSLTENSELRKGDTEKEKCRCT